MSVRLLYLIFLQVFRVVLLMGRTATAGDHAALVLDGEVQGGQP